MSFEIIADNGSRTRIPRGWVLLTLTLAAWGAVAVLGLAVYGLVQMVT